MIKTLTKRIVGTFVPRYRIPLKPGPIQVRDEVSGRGFTMLWREDSMIESQFYRHGLYGSWERHSLRLWAHLCAEAREVLDVGANTGVFSLLARCNNATARIVAVEPVPANAEVLQINVDANSAGVIVERAALSDQDGEATMYMLKDRLNYMTAVSDNRYALHPEVAGRTPVVPITIPITTWSSLRARHRLEGPDLIKIDVEGHEVAVMRSLREHIAATRPTILLEIIGDDNAAAIREMLRPVDYVFLAIDEQGRRAAVVDSLWDNDHQNFLLCRPEVVRSLQSKGLAIGTAGSA